ncbi:MAG: phenylalanine--tRNA ligase subunit beta, partial [Gammaproteobacteria bacterium]
PGSLPTRRPILFDPASLPRLVGFALPMEKFERILSRLGFGVEVRDNTLLVTPPGARFDIESEADLVEEIARIAGYELIPAVAPRRSLAAPRRGARDDELGGRLAPILLAQGYDEAVTLSLVAPARDAALAPAGSVAPTLANPLSERESVLRRSLWPGLLSTLAHNVAQGAMRVRLFERGTVFDAECGEREHLGMVVFGSALPEQWGVRSRASDFYDIKGGAEALLAAAGIGTPQFEPVRRAGLAPGRAARALAGGKAVAEFGVIDPALASDWDLPPTALLLELDLSALARPAVARARALPRFPSVRRDLALVVPARVTAAALLDHARRHAGGRLAEAFVFDVYTGPGIPEGARGVGMGLIFRDLCRTLTDAEVDVAVSAIVTGLAEEANIHVRS